MRRSAGLWRVAWSGRVSPRRPTRSPSGWRSSRERSSASRPRCCVSRRTRSSCRSCSRDGPKTKPCLPVTRTTDGSGPSASPRAAALVGAGIFLSRIAGFARDALMSRLLGVGAVMDVWALAVRIPNVIQVLLGEGTLSASMIPVYAEMLEEGKEEEAGRFAGAALGLVSVAAWGTALLGIFAASPIAELFTALSPDQRLLLASLLRLFFPMVALLAMSAWALAILNSHRRFFVSYVAPVLWNLGIITALVVFGLGLGWARAGRQMDLAVAVAWGALAGGALQLAVQAPFLVPVLRHFRLSLSARVRGVREAVRAFVPIVLARGVVSLGGLVDAALAALLAGGAISALHFAQRLYLLPISLFGLSVAAAELPELSRRRQADATVLAQRVRTGLRRVWLLVIPTAALYLAVGDLIVGTLYQGGDFGPDSTALVYLVLGAYAIGLPASAGSRMLSSAFFALRDTRTPALLSVVRMLLSAAVGVSLMFPLDRYGLGSLRLGAVGLALGASAAAWTEYGLLRRRLGRALQVPHGVGSAYAARVLVSAAVAGGAAWTAKLALGSAYPARRGWAAALVEALGGAPAAVSSAAAAAGTALLFGVVFLAAARATGLDVRPGALRRR
ncbi:MAG: murein biosynthesis integral membrane protein MurJ [Gemmatimonadetes bacterium]|nr:MAG: murein biosynthesis integral membrane protein MurJ [Gemmatimonadota bacterium]